LKIKGVKRLGDCKKGMGNRDRSRCELLRNPCRIQEEFLHHPTRAVLRAYKGRKKTRGPCGVLLRHLFEHWTPLGNR